MVIPSYRYFKTSDICDNVRKRYLYNKRTLEKKVGVFARLAGREMSDFSGKQILVLGRVQSVSDDEATITSADGTTITVGLDQNTSCSTR